MPELTLTFKVAKSTPGTYQFKEPPQPTGQRPYVGTLYLTKDAAARLGHPVEIEVTIKTTKTVGAHLDGEEVTSIG